MRKGEAVFERTADAAPIPPKETVQPAPVETASATKEENETKTAPESPKAEIEPKIDETVTRGVPKPEIAPHQVKPPTQSAKPRKANSKLADDIRVRTAAGLLIGILFGAGAHTASQAVDFTSSSRVVSTDAGVTKISISSQDDAQIRWELIQRRVEAAKRTADEIKSMEATLADPTLADMPDFRVGIENRIAELNMEIASDRGAVVQAVEELVDYSLTKKRDYQSLIDDLVSEAQQEAKYSRADRFSELNQVIINSNNSDGIDDESFATFWSSGIGLEDQFGAEGDSQ